jgi:hypothetical protein
MSKQDRVREIKRVILETANSYLDDLEKEKELTVLTIELSDNRLQVLYDRDLKQFFNIWISAGVTPQIEKGREAVIDRLEFLMLVFDNFKDLGDIEDFRESWDFTLVILEEPDQIMEDFYYYLCRL